MTTGTKLPVPPLPPRRPFFHGITRQVYFLGLAIGLYCTVGGRGQLVASLLLDVVWQRAGVTSAFGLGTIFAFTAIPFLAAVKVRRKTEA